MQPVPFLDRRLQERFDDDGAGVVEQHGDRAELFRRPFHCRFDLGFVGDVGDKMLGDMAACPDCRCGCGGGLAVAVDDRHLGAFSGEQLRGRPTHTRRAARNDSDLAGQSRAHFSAPCLTISLCWFGDATAPAPGGQSTNWVQRGQRHRALQGSTQSGHPMSIARSDGCSQQVATNL
jgi:hypothetical protein